MIELDSSVCLPPRRVNEQEVEREERIDREKREAGDDPRITEMEAIGAQIAPRGTPACPILSSDHLKSDGGWIPSDLRVR